MTDEDLDAILARAEVVENREDTAPGADLLSSFNVATFKADEDDAAFWNRLIPENLRPKNEPEQSDIGIRTARLRAMEASINMAEDGKKGGKPTTRNKGKDTGLPGPPIEGAVLRIDAWSQAVDPEGKLLGDVRCFFLYVMPF